MAFDPRTHASAHFSWKELACKDWLHTAFPHDWRDDRGRPLAEELERIRQRLSWALDRDCPLYVNSAYRTLVHNTDVNGRAHSQHLEGRAADVSCPHDCSFDVFRQAVLDAASDSVSRIRYIKVYRDQGFIHLDIRPTKKLVVDEGRDT